MLTSNLTIAGFGFAILLAVGGATWNLRGFITSEIAEATAGNTRLESAVADIRQEIRAGRESTDRQMAEIRRFIVDLYGEDDDDNNNNNKEEEEEDTGN